MRIRSIWLSVGLMALAVLAGCSQPPPPPAKQPADSAAKTPTPTPPAASPTLKQYSGLPPMTIAQNKKYSAVLKTNMGDITVELFAKEAPQTVNSFVFLARDGYYRGVPFHRVIKEFMIQTGDPTGTGAGGPGYNVPDELTTMRPYDVGIVAMANTGRPNTGGGQFFICSGPECRTYLDPQRTYTQFGRVVQGIDVVQKIAGVKVGPAGRGENSKPLEDVRINEIEIREG